MPVTFKPNVGVCNHCGHDHFNRECPTCHDADGPCRALLQWEARVFRANLETKVNAVLVDLKRAPTAQFMTEPTPTPEAPKRGMDAADLAMPAETVGRTREREDVINWLTEAQFHVVTQDEVRVILKIREQIKAGRHVPKVRP